MLTVSNVGLRYGDKKLFEEFSEETKQMLSCLKPQDRELFIKLYVEEKPFDEISKEMNTNKPVLYNRLFRSKKKLRSLFPQTNSTHLTGGTSYEK